MNGFALGEKYMREDISGVLGGNPISYLPIVDGKVVAVCVRLDWNPHAPDVVLVGRGQNIEEQAEMLLAQGDAVPVFVKGFDGFYEYHGEYRAVKKEHDAKKLKEWQEMTNRDHKVLWAFYLEKE